MNKDQVGGVVRAYASGMGGFVATILVGSFGMTGELANAWAGLIALTISTAIAVWSVVSKKGTDNA